MHVQVAFAASKRGAWVRAGAFRHRLMAGGGAGGAWSGKVFKPNLASPGGVAGVSGGASHRCGFVAGLPMRAWFPRVLPLCRARSRWMSARGAVRAHTGLFVQCWWMRRGTSNDSWRFHPHSRKIVIVPLQSSDCIFLSALECLTRMFVQA